MAVVAADWSELPKDLLYLISQRIDNEIDLIRFRSICSTWRSSTIPYHDHILQFKVPIAKYKKSYFCYLSKRSHFLIKPSPQQQQQKQTLVHRPWLIRIANNSTGKTKLLHPQLLPPFHFHSTDLDFIKLSVLHLGTDFNVDEQLRCDYKYRYPKKVVAVTPLILAILFYYKNHLVLLRCGDERWIEIPDMPSSIGDICVFKGKLYAVEEHSSKIVKVGPEDLSVQLVAKDVHGEGSDIHFLVESEGELLLVDVYESFSLYFDLAGKRAHKLKIHMFRLDEKEKKWVKLKSLGDRILFLGNGCSFSTSASDLYVAKGNCVIFMDDVFYSNMLCTSGMSVFHLDKGRLSPLCDYPDYLNLFWPPPKWIIKGCTHKSKKSMLSCLE